MNVPEPYGSQGATDTWPARAENVFRPGGPIWTISVDACGRMVRCEGRYELGGVSHGDFAEKTATNAGVFARNRLELGARWELSCGGRVDRQDFEGMRGCPPRGQRR